MEDVKCIETITQPAKNFNYKWMMGKDTHGNRIIIKHPEFMYLNKIVPGSKIKGIWGKKILSCAQFSKRKRSECDSGEVQYVLTQQANAHFHVETIDDLKAQLRGEWLQMKKRERTFNTAWSILVSNEAILQKEKNPNDSNGCDFTLNDLKYKELSTNNHCKILWESLKQFVQMHCSNIDKLAYGLGCALNLTAKHAKLLTRAQFNQLSLNSREIILEQLKLHGSPYLWRVNIQKEKFTDNDMDSTDKNSNSNSNYANPNEPENVLLPLDICDIICENVWQDETSEVSTILSKTRSMTEREIRIMFHNLNSIIQGNHHQVACMDYVHVWSLKQVQQDGSMSSTSFTNIVTYILRTYQELIDKLHIFLNTENQEPFNPLTTAFICNTVYDIKREEMLVYIGLEGIDVGITLPLCDDSMIFSIKQYEHSNVIVNWINANMSGKKALCESNVSEVSEGKTRPESMIRLIETSEFSDFISSEQKQICINIIKSRPLSILDARAGQGKSRIVSVVTRLLCATKSNHVVIAPYHKHLARLRKDNVECMTVASLCIRCNFMFHAMRENDFINEVHTCENIEDAISQTKDYILKHIGNNECFFLNHETLYEIATSLVNSKYNNVHAYKRSFEHAFKNNDFFVIVDEASTLTTEDISSVFESIRPTQVLLVGHTEQLSPVGMGQPFKDLAKILEKNNQNNTQTSCIGNMFTLSQNFRCDNTIVSEAEKVLDKMTPRETQDVVFVPLSNNPSLDLQNEQMLSTMLEYQDMITVVGTNEERKQLHCALFKMQEKKMLNFRDTKYGLLHPMWSNFWVEKGDKIIVKNPPGEAKKKGIYNAMEGTVIDVVNMGINERKEHEGEQYKIIFQTNTDECFALESRKEVGCMQPARFVTCHSIQGSEYDMVGVYLHGSVVNSWGSRNWVYVGFTRAVKKLYVYFCDESKIKQIVSRDEPNRNTFIQRFFCV